MKRLPLLFLFVAICLSAPLTACSAASGDDPHPNSAKVRQEFAAKDAIIAQLRQEIDQKDAEIDYLKQILAKKMQPALTPPVNPLAPTSTAPPGQSNGVITFDSDPGFRAVPAAQSLVRDFRSLLTSGGQSGGLVFRQQIGAGATFARLKPLSVTLVKGQVTKINSDGAPIEGIVDFRTTAVSTRWDVTQAQAFIDTSYLPTQVKYAATATLGFQQGRWTLADLVVTGQP